MTLSIALSALTAFFSSPSAQAKPVYEATFTCTIYNEVTHPYPGKKIEIRADSLAPKTVAVLGGETYSLVLSTQENVVTLSRTLPNKLSVSTSADTLEGRVSLVVSKISSTVIESFVFCSRQGAK